MRETTILKLSSIPEGNPTSVRIAAQSAMSCVPEAALRCDIAEPGPVGFGFRAGPYALDRRMTGLSGPGTGLIRWDRCLRRSQRPREVRPVNETCCRGERRVG
jgi:hypothetical protein